MKLKKTYLFSYNFSTNNGNGTGNIRIIITFKNVFEYLIGYKASYIHGSKKVIANDIRKQFNIPLNKKVKVVIINIIKV